MLTVLSSDFVWKEETALESTMLYGVVCRFVYLRNVANNGSIESKPAMKHS